MHPPRWRTPAYFTGEHISRSHARYVDFEIIPSTAGSLLTYEVRRGNLFLGYFCRSTIKSLIITNHLRTQGLVVGVDSSAGIGNGV